MIDELIDIANQIESKFKKETFSKVAFEALSSLQLSCDTIELENKISDLINKKDLPKQVNLYNVFGQPPLTVFNNDQFVVDIYFWQDNDTSIHSHSFSGAFKVFSGNSLHEVFKVERLEKNFDDIYASKLTLSQSELLSSGNTCEILSGELFIHRLVHLTNPTITICLRTIDDQDENQWQYFPSVSIQKNNISEIELKKLFFLEYQFLQERPNFEKKLIRFIESLTLSKKFNLFEKLHLQSFRFTEVFNLHILEKLGEIISLNYYFELYENYYNEVQNYIHSMDDTAEDRLLSHSLNNNYEFAVTKNLFKQLSNSNFESFYNKYTI